MIDPTDADAVVGALGTVLAGLGAPPLVPGSIGSAGEGLTTFIWFFVMLRETTADVTSARVAFAGAVFGRFMSSPSADVMSALHVAPADARAESI